MTDKTVRSFSVRLSVPFHHVDPMQVVWHGHYFEYFEAARDNLFESLGINLESFYVKYGYIFPVIRGAVKFIRPLRYKDIFVCTARALEAKKKIVIGYEITMESGDKRCTTGSTEQVVLKMPEAEIQYKLPGEILEALGLQP
ncbi:MAG: acyl-CoA thioesterase [Deltaproteobacteria bacterium]|nr:acyl-CoA thioesterase [Deltaproteobacteria bacterium]MCL5792258.1 acyl-CoA thioesterase [Deltaproteobacteria bacterium]